MKHKIYGNDLPNIPFEPRPEGCDSPIWRYSQNPVINTNPFENAERVFNSAVMAFNGEFVGVFRADTKSGVPYLFLGHSKDGINFTFDPKPIVFHDQKGNKVHFEYAYDPRLVELEGTYYVLWTYKQFKWSITSNNMIAKVPYGIKITKITQSKEVVLVALTMQNIMLALVALHGAEATGP